MTRFRGVNWTLRTGVRFVGKVVRREGLEKKERKKNVKARTNEREMSAFSV